MKRNRKLAVVICICLILSFVSAVFPFRLPEEENRFEMSVYYLNEDRTGLVKAPYETGKTAKKEDDGQRNRYGRGYTGNE